MALHYRIFLSFLYTTEIVTLFCFILALVIVMERLPSLPGQAAKFS